ncbi:FIG006388: Possible exported protein [uncultured Candidatus Thioglobus sp.]|nr:FIG006388: Possible exported protein [uncultured Candidatus Thioglobus sp.]
MIKKTFSYSVKALKLSTWITAVIALLVIFLAGLFVIFPKLIEAPIEERLSELSQSKVELSNLHFDFKKGRLFLQIDALTITEPQQKNPIVKIDKLRWRVHLSSFLDNIYQSHFSIDTLTFYSSQNEFDFGQWLNIQNLDAIYFLESLNINKTLIKNGEVIEIAPIHISNDEGHFSVEITGQDIGFGIADKRMPKVDISTSLSNAQLQNEQTLTLPVVIKNQEFLIDSQVKLSNQKGGNLIEIESDLKGISAKYLVKYLPSQLLSDEVYQWIKRGFIAGTLQDSKLYFKKNLSKLGAANVKFDTQLKDFKLLFDDDWQPLEQLDASLKIENEKITVLVNKTLLNGMILEDIQVKIADVNQANIDVEVTGEISTQSEDLLDFLRISPLNATVGKTLETVTLSGQVNGDMRLIIPLDKRAPILDVDLQVKNNRLTVLNGAISVEDYNSKLAFHNNKITTVGTGNIRGISFDIRVNPNNRTDDQKATFGVELIDNHSGLEAHITKRTDQSWRARIESESIKGNIEVQLNENSIPDVRLLGVQVTTLGSIQGDWQINPQDFPDMNLSTKGVYIDENVLPDFKVNLKSKDNILSIGGLQFEGIEIEDKALSFNGVWEDGKTRLHAKAKGDSLAKFLKSLKVTEKVTGGAFDFDLQLACECAPWNMNYQDISADLKMDIKEGVFTDKDPNIGRILSLLNIKSIAKRLKLSLSDVTNKGFFYDEIKAKIHLKDAIAKIENFNLTASSSEITLAGYGDIVDEHYNLEAEIVPAIGDAVPIATYLAGGGLAGLGIWLVDKTLFDGKIVDAIVGEIVTFKYKITGPWDEPVIEEL